MNVQYEILQYSTGNRPPIRKIFYGNLEKIFVYQVPNDAFFGDLSGKQQILVLLTPWKTEGKDATKTLTFVQTTLAPIVTDIRNVKAVVGLAETRSRSGIIDRAKESAFVGFDERTGTDSDDGEGGLESR